MWKDVRRSRSGRRRSRKRRRAATRNLDEVDRPTRRLSAAEFCTVKSTIAAAKEERAIEQAEDEARAREAPAPPVKRHKQPKRTKADIVQFVRTKREALTKQHHGLAAVECRIKELEAERAAMQGRHTIHKRAALHLQIEALRGEAQALETQEELVDFKHGCRSFLQTYAALELSERAADAVAVPKPKDILISSEKRKAPTARRRHVARPEMRMITGGQLNTIVATDAFLEQFDGAAKPLCLQSDEECALCGGALIMDVQADVMVCEVCRNEQMASGTSHKNGAAGTADNNLSASRYRRIVHYISHLQRFEGCVGSDKLTDALLKRVMNWLVENNVSEDRVSTAKVEAALRDMNLSDMVVYKTVITLLITGKDGPRFTPDQRTQLIAMFHDISNAFQVIKDRGEFPSRINFLSYPFVICKQLGLLSWGKAFQVHFRLLKGKENLSRQDMLWKAICKEAGLKFKSSV
jgi:hypothetical protein